MVNKILEFGGPRVWAVLSCVNKHWKNSAEEFAANKMASEPRMDRIPLQYRYDSSVYVLLYALLSLEVTRLSRRVAGSNYMRTKPRDEPLQQFLEATVMIMCKYVCRTIATTVICSCSAALSNWLCK